MHIQACNVSYKSIFSNLPVLPCSLSAESLWAEKILFWTMAFMGKYSQSICYTYHISISFWTGNLDLFTVSLFFQRNIFGKPFLLPMFFVVLVAYFDEKRCLSVLGNFSFPFREVATCDMANNITISVDPSWVLGN